MEKVAEVVSIHRVAVKEAPTEALAEVGVRESYGIEGDWRSRASSQRQLTLIEEEVLQDVARALGITVTPGSSRRQVVVRGLTLNSTVGKVLHVGDLELEITGLCDPCDNMERTIAPGARAALSGHGGINARVLTGGTLRVGDRVAVAEPVMA